MSTTNLNKTLNNRKEPPGIPPNRRAIGSPSRIIYGSLGNRKRFNVAKR